MFELHVLISMIFCGRCCTWYHSFVIKLRQNQWRLPILKYVYFIVSSSKSTINDKTWFIMFYHYFERWKAGRCISLVESKWETMLNVQVEFMLDYSN